MFKSLLMDCDQISRYDETSDSLLVCLYNKNPPGRV